MKSTKEKRKILNRTSKNKQYRNPLKNTVKLIKVHPF